MARRRTIVIAVLAVMLVVGLAVAGQSTSAGQVAMQGQVVKAHLAAHPAKHRGSCPAVIKFQGSITTNGPAVVKYIFSRSDNATDTITKTLRFISAGTQAVETTWTLGGATLPRYAGWEAITVLEPNSVMSNKARFEIRCTGQGEGGGRPDLVVRSFGLKEWGLCEPGSVLMTFQVTVANIGGAPSPAIPGKGVVQALDQDGTNWGNGAELPAVAAGGTQTVLIPVYYLTADPAHVVRPAPHPFKAIVNGAHYFDESDFGNNESVIINVNPREACRKLIGPKAKRPM
jgi:hypothetical protein